MLTREEKVERHFRNSVREKLIDLMSVMDPGDKLLWGAYNYGDLLQAAKERIEAEILHGKNFAENPPEEKTQTALALPKPNVSS